MDEFYTKRKGGAGHHGGEYQMKVIMFFLLKAFEGEHDFKFSSENLDDFSLDDAVLKDGDKNIFASIKHAEDENEKINMEALFSKSHNHTVLTPLESYKKIYLEHLEDLNEYIQKIHMKDICISTLKEYARTAVESFKVNSSNYEEIFKQLLGNICELKDKILMTKIKWFENSCPHLIINIEPHSKIKKEFALEKRFFESDFFFTDAQTVYYTFKPAETLAKIKSISITDEQEKFSDFYMTHFFKKFKLVILNDELLNRNIESKLRNLDIFKKSHVDFETTYYYIFNKIKYWYGSYKDGNKGYFLTRFHLEVIFSDLWNNAHVRQLKKLTNKFQFETESLLKKINEKTVILVKSPRYLLLMVKLQEKWYKEIEKEQILFVNPNDNIDLQKCSTKSFLYHKYTHLVCPLLIGKNEELVSDVNNILPNLRPYKKILLITELNLNIQHPNIVFINDEELYSNFRLKNIRRLKSMGDMDKYYVPRYFKWQYDTFSEEKFLKTIVESNEKFILVIDGPGMGKTTLLTNLTCKINQRDDLCALNIQLNHFTNVLKEGLKQNNLELEDFLPFTSTIEDVVETQIYTIPKIMYLMIDAVDEVSPKYTDIILQFLHHVSKRVAKIIVSSREHLKRELSESLNVNPYSLIPFTSQEQKQFIISYWICNLGLKNEDSIEKCIKYCDLLLKRLAHALSNQFWDCLGIPLQTRMISEIFLKGVSEEFTGCLQYLEGINHNITLPGDISLGRLYDLFVDRRREIYLEKCNIHGNVAAEQAIIKEFNSYTTLCEEISVRLLFSRKYWNLFNLKDDDMSKYDENLYKIGLLILPAENWWTYSHDSSSEESDTGHSVQRPQFFHRSFGEYFASKIICRKLFDNTNAELKFTKFFLNIFLKDKHVYVQRFIESTLANNYDRISGEIERQFQEVLQNTIFTPDINLNMLPYRGCLHILKKFLGSTNHHKEWINILYGANKENLLHNSVKHLEILKQLVAHGADVNLKSMFDRTVLHCAAEHGYIEAAKYLIERVDDIDAETQAGLTPLHEAIFSNHSEIAKLLVEKGASIKKRTGGGWTSLHYAGLMGNLELVKFLLRQGADVNEQTATNFPGRTTFIIAFGKKYFEICEYLLSVEGININLNDNNGWGLWSYAVTLDNDAFDFLNKIRERYNIEIETDLEALCLVVKKTTDCKRLQYLLDLRFDINSKNREGWTPLLVSVQKRKKDMFTFLIDKNADKKVTNKDDYTILHVAARTGDLDMFIMVEKHFDNFNSKTVGGQNILHLAAMSGNLQLVQYICKKSKKLPFENSLDDSTCLHSAAQSNCVETIQYLVEKVGVGLTAQAKNGKTALHIAVEQGHEDIIKFIVDKLKKDKIDVNFKMNGSFVLFVPNIKFQSEITQLLLKSGVKESIIKTK